MTSSKVIITFKDATPKETIDKAIADLENNGGKVTHRYDSTILGFSAEIPDGHLSLLKEHQDVEAMEADGNVSIYAKGVL